MILFQKTNKFQIRIQLQVKELLFACQDVWCWEMRRILELMYTGQTKVPDLLINPLMEAAERLGFGGLTSKYNLDVPLDLSGDCKHQPPQVRRTE